MLIALFTMLAMAIFGSEDSPFLIPKIEKKIKHTITDKDRKKEILAVMKDYKKDWKALGKTKKKQVKSFGKLNKDRNADPQVLLDLFETSRQQRAEQNNKLINGRIKVAGLIKQEEWDNLMKGVLEVKPKTTKKLTKAEAKTLLKQDKKLMAIGDEIEAAFTDSAKREEATKYLLQFEENIAELLAGSQELNYKDQEVLRNREASSEEIARVIQKLENFRTNVHQSYLDLRKKLVELSTEENWPALAKALGKFIKD